MKLVVLGMALSGERAQAVVLRIAVCGELGRVTRNKAMTSRKTLDELKIVTF